MKKGILITIAVIAVIFSAVWAYIYSNPGVYVKYKCNHGGDSSRKFYDPNWQARGAVCDGYYIPFGSILGGKNKPVILAKMEQIQPKVPQTKAEMKKLAEQAASLV